MERVRLEFPATDLVHRHRLPVRIGAMNYGRHLAHDAVTIWPHRWDVFGHPSMRAGLTTQYRAEALIRAKQRGAD